QSPFARSNTPPPLGSHLRLLSLRTTPPLAASSTRAPKLIGQPRETQAESDADSNAHRSSVGRCLCSSRTVAPNRPLLRRRGCRELKRRSTAKEST
ncbi:unnamed protein product, partial [Linum tenue]